MKKTKRIVSVILIVAMLFAFASISHVQSAVADTEEPLGANGNVYLDPGAAYRENTTWYAWTWYDSNGFENGSWKTGAWKKDDFHNDLVYFDMVYWYVIFVCMPDSETEPSLEKALFKTSEIDTGANYSEHIFTVTGFNENEGSEIVGKWSIYPPEEEEPQNPYGISDVTFDLTKPLPSETYYVGEPIAIKVNVKMYIYNNNSFNSIIVEISKDNIAKRTSVFHYKGVNVYPTDKFTPDEPGVYTVRAGYSINRIDYVDDDNCVGSFDITVLPKGVTPTAVIGDVNGDKSVDVLDATVIQKYSSEKADLNNDQLAAGDVNNDGNVDVIDAAEIQKFAAGKITEFKKKS